MDKGFVTATSMDKGYAAVLALVSALVQCIYTREPLPAELVGLTQFGWLHLCGDTLRPALRRVSLEGWKENWRVSLLGHSCIQSV